MAGSEHVRFTGVDGIELVMSVLDGGRDDATPVVLLHGLSQQRAFWSPVIRRLAARPVAAIDQRGHGESDTDLAADFSVPTCAGDVIAALDRLEWSRAVIVGHSWGASVALAVGAAHPDRVAAVALIDGGLWSLKGLGTREEVRARLTPPALGLPPEQLWQLIRQGDLGPYWSPDVQSALAPSFVTNEQGDLNSRLGRERHLRVLDGMLDVEPDDSLAACEASGTQVWAVVCEAQPEPPQTEPPQIDAPVDPWSEARRASVLSAEVRPNVLMQRWGGAIHDVPLQWPALVAGLIDTVVGTQNGGTQ